MPVNPMMPSMNPQMLAQLVASLRQQGMGGGVGSSGGVGGIPPTIGGAGGPATGAMPYSDGGMQADRDATGGSGNLGLPGGSPFSAAIPSFPRGAQAFSGLGGGVPGLPPEMNFTTGGGLQAPQQLMPSIPSNPLSAPGGPLSAPGVAPRYVEMARRYGPDYALSRMQQFQAGTLPGQQGRGPGAGTPPTVSQVPPNPAFLSGGPDGPGGAGPSIDIQTDGRLPSNPLIDPRPTPPPGLSTPNTAVRRPLVLGPVGGGSSTQSGEQDGRSTGVGGMISATGGGLQAPNTLPARQARPRLGFAAGAGGGGGMPPMAGGQPPVPDYASLVRARGGKPSAPTSAPRMLK